MQTIRLTANEIRSVSSMPLNAENIRLTFGIEDTQDIRTKRPRSKARSPCKRRVQEKANDASSAQNEPKAAALPPPTQPEAPLPMAATTNEESDIDEGTPRYGDLLSDWAL